MSTLPNIISVYEYNQELGNANYCVTGDEDTCKLSNCYKTKTENSCPPGTIVNYKVNNSKIVRFHVVHDDGETMTLQSQENTIYNFAF